MSSKKSALKEPGESLRTLESVIQALVRCGVCTSDDDITVVIGADGGVVKVAYFDDDHPKGGYAISQELAPGTTLIISFDDGLKTDREPGMVPIDV